MRGRRFVDDLQHGRGAAGGVLNPTAQRGVVGNLLGGQEQAQQILDLTQADAHGKGGDGELLLLSLAAGDHRLRLPLQNGDLAAKLLILGLEFGSCGLRA